jgi:hypothetical protein
MAGAFGRMLQGVSAADHAHEIGPDAAIRLRCADGSSFLARAARRASDRCLHARADLASAHSASIDRLRKRRSPAQRVRADACRGSSGWASCSRRRYCLGGGTLRRVAGNATRRPQGDLPEDRRETPGRARWASDTDRHLAIARQDVAFSSHLGGAGRLRMRLTGPRLTSLLPLPRPALMSAGTPRAQSGGQTI